LRHKTHATPAIDAWQEQLRRGGLEMAVMLAVAAGPRYGLEIIRHLDDERDLTLPEGTIYPLLSRLTRDGFVLGEWRATEPHPRKYYTLTPRGRRRLTEMCGAWRAFAGKMNKLIAEAGE
jgi:PadR family transcriptional regulator, regulatory protein PadR